MKKLILDFLKGIPIGIANVIPGFSGGTMAVILNVYERLIAAISDILRRPFKALKEAGVLFLGVLAGVVIAVELIVFLLENFPIPTTMFFVGLIIGSIPNIRAKAGQNKIKPADVAAFFICVTVIIVFSFIKGKTPSAVDYDFKIALLIFFLSVIAAAAMIIPGVSGSLVFLAFGYYDFIWKDLMGNFINAVIGFNISGAVNGFVRLLPFILGVAAGIILIAKAIKFCSRSARKRFITRYSLLIASPLLLSTACIANTGRRLSKTTVFGNGPSAFSRSPRALIS